MEEVYSFESIIYIAIPIITLLLILLINSTKYIKVKQRCPSCMKKTTEGATKCPYCQSDIIIDDNFKKIQETNKIKKLNTIKSVILLIIGIIYVFIATYIFDYTYDYGQGITAKMQKYAIIGLTTCIINIIIFTIKNLCLKQKNYLGWLIIIGGLIGIMFDAGYIKRYKEQSLYDHNYEILDIIEGEEFTVPEAKIILKQIHDIFNDEYGNIELYYFFSDSEKPNTFVVNLQFNYGILDYESSIQFNMEIDDAQITRIYYPWNKNIDIEVYDMYEGGKVDNFIYHINCLSYDSQQPPIHIKDRFEEQVKEKLKSPSSAIFTYDSILYSKQKQRYYYSGYVESQNEYGAMIKRTFKIEVLPKEVEYQWSRYSTDFKYEW